MFAELSLSLLNLTKLWCLYIQMNVYSYAGIHIYRYIYIYLYMHWFAFGQYYFASLVCSRLFSMS